MKRLHSVERLAFHKAQETLWQTMKLCWTDLRYDHQTRNHMIAQEIIALGHPVTWVQVAGQMQPQVFRR